MPENLTTLAHLSVSAAINVPKSAAPSHCKNIRVRRVRLIPQLDNQIIA
jgi:hypothetical protein